MRKGLAALLLLMEKQTAAKTGFLLVQKEERNPLGLSYCLVPSALARWQAWRAPSLSRSAQGHSQADQSELLCCCAKPLPSVLVVAWFHRCVFPSA